ncbi:MAG TPA: MarP family serine protease [Solirubrobacteraceae bacterium]|nr:MarP family serine protease [Solirubrobacteraceae bacterium]
MNAVDILIILVAALFGFVGFARGFLIGILSLVGFAGGAYLGTRFGPLLLDEGHASPFAPLFGLLGALVGGMILSAGAETLAGTMRSGIRSPTFALFDGLLGSALAIALGLALAWLISVVILQIPGVRDWRRPLQRSVILQELNAVLPSDRVLKALARFDPFPAIRGPEVDVRPPRSSVARDPDVRAAGDSIVRVLSNSCGLGVAGSGWVAAPGIVVTNAHVVAGAGRTSVEPNGSDARLDATAIAFDRRNDIAVLRVPGLDRPALRFAREVKVSEPGAVLGFPLSGAFRVIPARVGRTATVRVNDAYGRRLVRRRVTGFRADVQPGNSGGPIVDVAGRVSGTVFSKVVVGTDGGYAVPNDIVRRRLREADGPVGTGPCVN